MTSQRNYPLRSLVIGYKVLTLKDCAPIMQLFAKNLNKIVHFFSSCFSQASHFKNPKQSQMQQSRILGFGYTPDLWSFYARLMNINGAVRTKTLLNVTPWIISISKCSVRFSYISVYFKSTPHYFMLCLNESWWFDIGSGSAVKPTCHECLNSQERLGGWTPSFSLHHLTCFPNC